MDQGFRRGFTAAEKTESGGIAGSAGSSAGTRLKFRSSSATCCRFFWKALVERSAQSKPDLKWDWAVLNVFRRGVPTMIGNGGPVPQSNEINGLDIMPMGGNFRSAFTVNIYGRS